MWQIESEETQILSVVSEDSLSAMKKLQDYIQNPLPGKPINQEFWDFLNQEREFSINYLFHNNSDLSREDCEDVYGELIQSYAELADRLGNAARRFEELNRKNLISRVEWKKKDFIIRRKAKRRGRGVVHASMDDVDFNISRAELAIQPEEIELPVRFNILLDGLAEASTLCEGKQLVVVNALQTWLAQGCPSESWYDHLSSEEVESFLVLKKGVSLSGKISPTFTKVKKLLREIITRGGLLAQ